MKFIIKIISAAILLVYIFTISVGAVFKQQEWEKKLFPGVSMYDDMNIIIDNEDVDVEVGDNVTSEYKMLKQIGIILGNQYDTPTDGNSMTRAGFIQIVARALKIDGQSSYDQVFVDVPQNHYAFNEICAAAKLGIISGYNGYFNENDAISYVDAATILVNMLGRGQEAKSKGDYQTGYILTANKYDIFRGVNYENYLSDAIPNDLYRMLVNTVSSYDFVDFSLIDNNYVRYNGGRNILEVCHGIYSAAGVVDAVGKSNTLSDNEYELDDVKIGDMIFKGEYKRYIDFLGMYVEILYKETNSGNRDIVFVEATNRNSVLIIDAEDIDDYANNKYTYWVDDKRKSASIKAGAPVVYNGKINTNGIENVYKPESGYVTLINNDGGREYDVVIVKSVEDIVIGTIINETGTVYDYLDQSKTIKMDENDTDILLTIQNSDGVGIYTSMLNEKDVLSVMKSADGKIINAIQSTDKVTGKIKYVKNSNDKTTVMIDDISYTVTRDCATRFSKVIVAGKEVTLYLNAYGTVVYAEDGIIGSTSPMTYGYIIGIAESNQLFDDNISIKLLSQDGEIKVYNTNNKVKIDGMVCNSRDKIIAALKAGFPTYASGENKDIGVMMYSVTEDGTMKEIDTPYINTEIEDENKSLRLIYNQDKYLDDLEKGNLTDSEKNNGIIYKGAGKGGVFSESIYWTPERTVLFRINTSESNERDRYRVETKSSPYENDKYYGNKGTTVPEIYRNTDSYYADAIVHIDSVASNEVASTDIYAVKTIEKTIVNDEEMTAFVVTQNGVDEATIYIEDSRLQGKDIEAGDLIVFDEVNGKVMGNNIRKLYDFSTGENIFTDSDSTWFNAVFRRVLGYVYEEKDGMFTIYSTDNYDGSASDTIDDLASIVEDDMIGNPKIMVANIGSTEIVKISKNARGDVTVTSSHVGELKPYIGCGNEATRIYLRYMYLNLQQVFIFE